MENKQIETKKIALQLNINGRTEGFDGEIKASVARHLKKLYQQQVVRKGVSLKDFEEDLNKHHPILRKTLDDAVYKAIREFFKKNGGEIIDGYAGPFRMESDFDGENWHDYPSGNSIEYDFTDFDDCIED